ncbi:hypothetical protein JKF63_01314 [Porcisia hertigi]|uniref:Kinase n=1 Tax=Porcisia hertigi TaxID=2761500 RepID=A0A836HHF6_9TRYP|nr:hypothetical protein JKF63_01314 [Porcisia hertigi]
MSNRCCAIPFDAVGGHKSAFFYGEAARDGRSTLQKKTTAWEVMYYLAMEIAKDGTLAQDTTAPRSHDEVRAKFVHAAGKLSVFTPSLVSIRFPDNYATSSAALKPYMNYRNNWVIIEAGAPDRSAVVVPLFNELFDGAEELQGFTEEYDTGIWGIGLIDETSGMQKPCVMDIKIGFVRHSPVTPADKVARMLKNEHNSLTRRTAIRICGSRRYIPTKASIEGSTPTWTCERFGKDIGHAVSHERELSTCIRNFLSVRRSLAEVNENGEFIFPSESMDGMAHTEKAQMEKRMRGIRANLKSLVHFLESTPEGAFMLQHMALVSTSVLLLYDAVASPRTAKLLFIDFARSTWRKFNFDEPTIGLIQGLKNLDKYLSM